MSKIKLLCSSIVIEDYERNKDLEYQLSNFDKSVFEFKYKLLRYIEDENGSMKCVIPRCFPIAKLQELFPEHTVVQMTSSYKYPHIDIKMKLDYKNDLQKEAVRWLLENKHTQHLVNLRVGAGKTYIAMRYISESLYNKAIIIVDETKTLEQWKERILEYIDLKEEDIGVIQGSPSFTRIMKQPEQYKLFLGMHKTLDNAIESKGPLFLHQFFFKLGIGIKIYDEAQINMHSIYIIDTHTNVLNTVYLTGTALRTNWLENKHYGYIIPTKYGFGSGSKNIANDERYHSINFVSYNTNCSSKEALSMTHRIHGFMASKWADYSCKDDNLAVLTEVTMKFVDYVREKYGIEQYFIVLKTKEQCLKFAKALNIRHDVSEDDIGFYSTIVDKIEDRKQQLYKKFVLTTDKSFGKALDFDAIDCIFNFIPMSSEAQNLQLTGRIRNNTGKSALYYNFLDDSIEAHIKIGNVAKRTLRKISKVFRLIDYVNGEISIYKELDYPER